MKFLWSCVNCRIRVETICDFHINDRPICVHCNAEMEPYVPHVTPLVGRLDLLEEFFRTVAGLTANHDGAHFYITDNHERKLETDIAVVSPAKLGEALEKVDPEWWKQK